MTIPRDPDTMPPEARLAEIAEIFGRGYLRASVKGRISSGELALPPHGEAPCVSTVNTPERENT